MKMARFSASAGLVDGNIYVLGEVFDPKTQTWVNFVTPKMSHNIHQSVVIEEKKVYYAVDEEAQSFYFLLSEGIFQTSGKKDSSTPKNRNNWCTIGKLLYCRGTRGRILWCEPDELIWKEVKGLEELQLSLCGSRMLCSLDPKWQNRELTKVKYDICRLCSNSAGNVVIFWTAHLGDPESLELWSAEVSLERREGGEIRGKIEWSSAIYKLDPLSHSA
ncbi:unnamed protein product [Arabidopsis halleri]